MEISIHDQERHPVWSGCPTPPLVNLAERCGNDRRAIYAKMKEDWPLFLRDAQQRDRAMNANTFSSSLTTNFLILGATTVAASKFAALRMFSRDVMPDPFKPLASGVMKYVTTPQTAGNVIVGTTGSAPASYESANDTITPVNITVNQYTQPFAVTNTDLNSGIRLNDLVVANMANLGVKISKVFCAYITAANFNVLTPIISTAGAWGFDQTQQLWGLLKKANRRHLMLDGPYLAKLVNVPSLFQPTPVVPGAGWANLLGFDYVALHTEWSAAGQNIIGFGCDPQAMGAILGLPLVDIPSIPGGSFSQGNGLMVGLDVPIGVTSWFNVTTRTYWASYDMMAGFNALDTSIACVIASGTPT
jgi:hypothetical protein